MKKIEVTLRAVIEVDEGYDLHLQAGEPWAYAELERRLAATLNAKRVIVEDVNDTWLADATTPWFPDRKTLEVK